MSANESYPPKPAAPEDKDAAASETQRSGLEGLIERDPGSFQDGVPQFYRNRECPVRSSAMTVPKDVRDRISATLSPLGPDSPAALCARARQAGVPVVMFGLRGEDMAAWLNTAVELGRDKGWPEPEQPFDGVIEGFDTQVRDGRFFSY